MITEARSPSYSTYCNTKLYGKICSFYFSSSKVGKCEGLSKESSAAWLSGRFLLWIRERKYPESSGRVRSKVGWPGLSVREGRTEGLNSGDRVTKPCHYKTSRVPWG